MSIATDKTTSSIRYWERLVATIAVVCATLLHGCASFAPSHPHTPLANQVEVGDRVRVITVDGDQTQFTITNIDENGVYGEEEYVRFKDITEISIRKKFTLESASNAAVVGIVLGIILALDALGVGDAS